MGKGGGVISNLECWVNRVLVKLKNNLRCGMELKEK